MSAEAEQWSARTDALDAAALAHLAARTAQALPTFSPEERAVGLALYRLLAAGAVVRADRVAAAAGISVVSAARVLAQLPTAARDGEGWTGFLGLQLTPGRHRLAVSGRELGTWCAWDTLFIPQLLGAPAVARSTCPVTRTEIVVALDPLAGVTALEPAGVVLSLLADPEPFAGDVISGFCRWVNFYADATAAAVGAQGAPPLVIVRPEDGFALGTRTNERLFGVTPPAPGTL